MSESMNWRVGDIVKPKQIPGNCPYELVLVWQHWSGKWHGTFQPVGYGPYPYDGCYPAICNDLDAAFMKLMKVEQQKEASE